MRDTDTLLLGFLAWRNGGSYGALRGAWITFDPYVETNRRVCGVCDEFFTDTFDPDEVKLAKTEAHRAQHTARLTGAAWDAVRAALAASAVDLACELVEEIERNQ